METSSIDQDTAPKPSRVTKKLLDFPQELTLSWIEMIDDPNALFNLSRVGNWNLFHLAKKQLLKTNSVTLHSALYWASMKGDLDLLRLALNLGADINYTFQISGSTNDYLYSTIEGLKRQQALQAPAYRVASSALSIAIRHQQIDIIKILLNEGALSNVVDLDKICNRPHTPLQWALYQDRSIDADEEKRCQIVTLLLDHGVDSIAMVFESWGPDIDPFMNALLNEHIPLSIVERMMRLCYYLDSTCVHPGLCAHHYYFEYQRLHSKMPSHAFLPIDLQKLKFLLDAGQSPGFAPAWTNFQLVDYTLNRYIEPVDLSHTKQEQHLRLVVERYIESPRGGLSCPRHEPYAKSPLVAAMQKLTAVSKRNGDQDCYPSRGVRLLHILLDAGVDATQCQTDNLYLYPEWLPYKFYPFDEAENSSHESIPLAFLCLPQHPDCLQISVFMHYLLQQGVPVDTQDIFGLTALHFASKYSVLPRVKQLIEHGACVNMQDNRGLAALHFACRIDLPLNVDDLLVPSKCRKRSKAQKKRLDVCRVLLRNGADPTMTDRDGFTPLHYACKYGFVNLVKLLLSDYRVNVKAVANDFTTALHVVSWDFIEKQAWHDPLSHALVRTAAKAEIAKLLLDAGADARAKDKDGLFPISYARRHANLGVFDVLLDHGGYDGLGLGVITCSEYWMG